ncbi:MAG: hypothetical protein Tp1123DCM1511741_4 [Prokaryotic dsDNA virus sp.]|nr:MAG: hypothetical protein Tp1123DCM1511741_4 [Prokaryotic dsDNA virus sp.]|tara:strand:- start:1603 stop:1839 length:237 start_codon:yes stop_codon:yes gene_type:complete
MKIKMIVDAVGSANESGNATRRYKKDEIIDCDTAWKQVLGKIFVDEGQAQELKVSEPKETKKEPKVKVTKKKVVKKKK